MTSIIHQPSDKLFKLSMGELAVAKEFFSARLPADLLNRIDLDSLALQKGSFIDEAYKTTEADVVYKAQLGSASAYLYLLCEHQTQVDKRLAFRLLVYTVRLMERHLKQHPNDALPLVYPMVVYTGDEPWNAPLDLFPLFIESEDLARKLLFKPYSLLDVQRTPDNDLRREELFGLVAFAFKHRKTADFEQFLKHFMPWLHEVEIRVPCGASLSRIVIKYIIDRSPQGDKDLLVKEAQHYLSQELQGDVMTIAQQWEQEGIQKGILQGRQQGESALLKRQLQRRFGDIPFIYEQRVNQADAQDLLSWGEKILDAKTIEEVFS